MLKPPSFTRRGHDQHLRHVLGSSRSQIWYQIGHPPDEVLRRMGVEPAPGGGAVHQLELVQAQRRPIHDRPQLFGRPQQLVGWRQLHASFAEHPPLTLLNRPPAPELTEHLVAITDHQFVGQIDPANRRASQMKRRPPQPAFRSFHQMTGKGRILGLQRRGGLHQPLLGGGKQIQREDGQPVDTIPATALACRIEWPDALDAIVIELNPHSGLISSPQIDHPASDRKLARLLHKIDAVIARNSEPSRKIVRVDRVADTDLEDRIHHRSRFRNRHAEHAGGRHKKIDLAVGQPLQHADRLQPRGQWRLHAQVGRCKGSGRQTHAQLGSQELQTCHQVLGFGNLRHRHHRRALRPTTVGQRRQNQGPRPRHHTAHRKTRFSGPQVASHGAEVGKWKGHVDRIPVPTQAVRVSRWLRSRQHSR
jgi:hypothetical protein